MEQLESDVRELKQDFKEVKDALIGNNDLGIRGMVQRVEYHADYISKDRKFKNKAIGILVGVQLAIASLFTYLKIK